MKTDDELRLLLTESMMGAAKFHSMYGKKYGFTLKRIQELSKQRHVAQVLAPAKPAVFQRIIAPDYSFQIDLTFWGPQDRPDAIIFVCIEMTSRKMWAEIIKNKSSAAVLPAFRKVLSEVTADVREEDAEIGYISADDGGEWSGCKKLCEELHVPWRIYTGENKSRKMALAERANRQIKDRIRAYQEPSAGEREKNAWKAQLPAFIRGYNDTLHSSIAMTPNEAYTKMSEAREHLVEREPDWDKEKFAVGDVVKLKVYKDHVFKKMVNQWSRENYVVSAVTDTGIEVEGGERPYQRYELLKVPKVSWNAPTAEKIAKHKEVETAEQKAARVRAVEREIGPVEELEPRAKPIAAAVVKKPVSLVRKEYEVVGHRGRGDDFELEVTRTVRGKPVTEWLPLSSFIQNGGIDATAFAYIKAKRLVKASGI